MKVSKFKLKIQNVGMKNWNFLFGKIKNISYNLWTTKKEPCKSGKWKQAEQKSTTDDDHI